MKCRRQGLTDEFAQVQNLAAFRDVRDQNLDKGMLAVERGASLVFRAHNPLNRCKVQLAKTDTIVVLAVIEQGNLRAAIPRLALRYQTAGLRKLRPILGSKNEHHPPKARSHVRIVSDAPNLFALQIEAYHQGETAALTCSRE
jgi:hypothetical protein